MIALVTTVHPRIDTRIRIKMAASLAQELDKPVTLFVQDGQGDAEGDGFVIRDTGARPTGRLRRMTFGTWRMFQALRRARPEVVHFHDPELIPMGLALRRFGIKVVYDVHEDLPRQVMGKPYLRPALRGLVSRIVAGVEALADRGLTGVIVATPAIGEHFRHSPVALVQNFPLPDELARPIATQQPERPPHFAFVGGITAIRGTKQMISAIDQVSDPEARLQLVGSFAHATHKADMIEQAGWQKVIEHGWADRQKVANILGQVRAGLVLYLPSPNHIAAQPNKLFEYMSAGLPVIASDFPLWRRIVDGAGCGLLVDPLDPTAIAKAMDWILAHPEEATAMGVRGRQAVQDTYNWDAEAATLLAFYRDTLGVPLKTPLYQEAI